MVACVKMTNHAHTLVHNNNHVNSSNTPHLPRAQASRVVLLLPLHHPIVVLTAVGQVECSARMACVDDGMQAHPRGDWVDQRAVELLMPMRLCGAAHLPMQQKPHTPLTNHAHILARATKDWPDPTYVVDNLPSAAVIGWQDGFVHPVCFLSSVVALLAAMALCCRFVA